MSITIQDLVLAYKVHTIPLNKILTDELVPLNSPIVYITKKPIAMSAKINDASNDSFDLTRVSIIELEGGVPVKSLYITTTTTSSETIEIITADHRIFSDIGIENSVVLIDPSGVEYNARPVQQTDGALLDNLAVRDTDENGATLDISGYSKVVLAFFSSLDKALTLKYYGSRDGAKFHQLGSDIAIAIGSVTEQVDIQSISDAWKWLRVNVSADDTPTVGNLTSAYSMKT